MALQNFARRIIGVSGFSNSWGIFSGNALFLAMICLQISSITQQKSLRLVSLAIIPLALFNLVMSGSRVVIAASIVVMFLLFLVQMSRMKSGVVIKAMVGAVCLLATGVAFAYFFPTEYWFILYRFDVLSATAGGSRVDQMAIGFSLLNTLLDYFFGVSSAVQRQYGISYGIEIEPVNIFVCYGIIGFSLIYYVVFRAIRSIRSLRYQSIFSANQQWNDVIKYGMFCWLFNLFVSFGNFVLQELVTGTFVWLLTGLVLGFSLPPGRRRNLQNRSRARHTTAKVSRKKLTTSDIEL